VGRFMTVGVNVDHVLATAGFDLGLNRTGFPREGRRGTHASVCCARLAIGQCSVHYAPQGTGGRGDRHARHLNL
jgi:hypothetical protein